MRFLMLPILAVLVSCLLLSRVDSAALGQRRREAPNGRVVVVDNQSGRRIEVYWINRQKNPPSFHANSADGEGYPYGATTAINSYIGHEFELRELPSKRSNECATPGQCRKGHFQVNDQEDQEIVINKDFSVDFIDAKIKAEEEANKLLDACQMSILTETEGISSLDQIDPLQLVDQLTDCMENRVNETLAIQEEERQFQAQLKQRMAEQLVPYACGDVNFTDTTEVINKTWHYTPSTESHSYGAGATFEYQMQIYHERPTSRIFRVPNFVTTAECEAMTKYFTSKDGTYIPYAASKDQTKQGQLVGQVSDRFYELVRVATGWQSLSIGADYEQHHQELFQIEEDEVGVTVLPPCAQEELDAAKEEGSAVTHCRLPGAMPAAVPTKRTQFGADSNRVADVFVFCGKPPSQLGGIHFPIAGVHLNPEANLLVMATHRTPIQSPNPGDPATKQTSWSTIDGFTTDYHLCPNHKVLTHSFFADPEDLDMESVEPTRKAAASEGEL